jgi:hypothetical protein
MQLAGMALKSRDGTPNRFIHLIRLSSHDGYCKMDGDTEIRLLFRNRIGLLHSETSCICPRITL